MLGHEHGYFWNSVDHDRVYNADSFSEWLRYFFTTGVFFGTCYVQADRGMDVVVQSGYVNIEGKVRIFDQDSTLTVSPAHASLPRIDSVVVERNDTERTFKAFIVEGTPARTAVAPAPVRENGVYQLVLAQINVRAGATSITQAAIKDTRPDDLICGYVAGTLRPAVWEQVVNQWKEFYYDFTESSYNDFGAWFQLIKDQLSTDAAGNLQNQINDITTDIGSIDGRVSVVEGITDKLKEEFYKVNSTNYDTIAPWLALQRPYEFSATIVRKSGIAMFYIRFVITDKITETENFFVFSNRGIKRFSPHDWFRVNISNAYTDDGFPLAWINREGKLQIWATSSKPLQKGIYYLSASYPTQED